jgi:hypothetical protein
MHDFSKHKTELLVCIWALDWLKWLFNEIFREGTKVDKVIGLFCKNIPSDDFVKLI